MLRLVTVDRVIPDKRARPLAGLGKLARMPVVIADKWTMPLAGLVTTIGVICLGIFDMCCVCFGGTGSSVSNFLVSSGFKAPAMVFAFGWVGGHLFGYMTPDNSSSVKLKLFCK